MSTTIKYKSYLSRTLRLKVYFFNKSIIDLIKKFSNKTPFEVSTQYKASVCTLLIITPEVMRGYIFYY